jgi:branched-subunit amino acid aminotransferase/4-amino-4-deoxychorismate lyase
VIGPYFSYNGSLRPVEEAQVSLEDVAFAYGYGVYETLKVRKGIVYFPDLHEERLFTSASIIELEHPFESGQIDGYLRDLIEGNGLSDANLKILLIGSTERGAPGKARLYIMALNPLFPDKRLYRDGATAISFSGERVYPQSKSLSMTVSTLAYGKARQAGAYDALLVDRNGYLTEGTRTNLYYTDGRAVYTPPADSVLSGVTKITLERLLRRHGISVLERPLLRSELPTWSGCFLTSTSSKVMPLRKVDDITFSIPELVFDIMRRYDAFLDAYAAGKED